MANPHFVGGVYISPISFASQFEGDSQKKGNLQVFGCIRMIWCDGDERPLALWTRRRQGVFETWSLGLSRQAGLEMSELFFWGKRALI